MRTKHLVLLMLVFLLAACNLQSPTAELPTLPMPTEAPTQPPTVEVLPTEPSVPATETPTLEPTAASTEIPGTLVEFNGVSFRIPTGVASQISGEMIPAVTDPDMPFFGQNPVQIHITLSDYILQGRFHEPAIIVSPIAEYEALGQVFADRFAEMKTVIDTRPADAQYLPFMPLFNAAQVFHTTPVYLDFQNGSGVRYLTQYDQAFMPITNHSLFYTFQGITADGKYHVALILPITHISLVADESAVTDWQTFSDGFTEYLAEIKTTLDTAPSAEFSPSLADLDALAQSLLVQPLGLP